MSQPLYGRIKDAIRRKILSGDWAEGFRLPSENALLVEFGVSRMTVHRALRELTSEGLLTRVQGLGTFVAGRRPVVSVVELRSVAREIADRGNGHRATVRKLEAVTADERLGREFNLPQGARLFHSVIVHCENEVPIQYEERWVNPAVAPDYLNQDFAAQTPTDYLMQLESAPEVEQVIEAVLPTPETAQALAIDVRQPCLRVTRRTWRGRQVVTVAHLVHPGSRYRLGTRFQAGLPSGAETAGAW